MEGIEISRPSINHVKKIEVALTVNVQVEGRRICRDRKYDKLPHSTTALGVLAINADFQYRTLLLNSKGL